MYLRVSFAFSREMSFDLNVITSNDDNIINIDKKESGSNSGRAHEQRRINTRFRKAHLNESKGKSVKPSLRSIFKTIYSFLKLANIIRVGSFFKTPDCISFTNSYR